jgi:hypothetical protein
MHYIKVLNKFQNHLSNNDKIRIFIDFLTTSNLGETKPSVDEKKFINHVCQKVFSQNKYQTRLAKIIHYMFTTCNQRFRESKYYFVLKCLIANKVKLDFNYQYKESTSLATALFHIASKVGGTNTKNRIDLYKNLFSFIAKQSDVTKLYYYQANDKTPFLNYFLNNVHGTYYELIYYVCVQHKSFGFELKDSEFLDAIIAFNHPEFEECKIDLLTDLPIEYITHSEKRMHSNDIFNFSYSTLDTLLYFCKEKTLKKLMELRPKIFDYQEINTIMILENHRLSLAFKTHLIEKFQVKRAPIASVYLATLNEEKMSEEKARNFIQYCESNLEIFKEENQFENLNHLLCMFREWLNPFVLKNIILNQKLPHLENKYGYYPIHFLASYSTCQYNPPKMDDIIHILRKLKENQVDLNSMTKSGNNALHIALRLQKPPLFIKELLLADVKVCIKNKYGKTAFDYFKNYRFKDKEKLNSLFTSYYEKEKLETQIANDKIFIEEKKVKKI